MRIDVITIFPDYFSTLEISLLGKARENNLLDVQIHDLRDFTHDKHRTVDDTPYGGGAGMLMKPEPWGEALESIVGADRETVIIFTTPAGELFKQATAHELAGAQRIVFCCGRYEGIDQRVVEFAKTLGVVREISLGDYVLNGGEVAALAITEAVARLIPGVIGNADSLSEESHSEGLLEYPSYTKPAVWQGMAVPDVLLSGNHAAIAKWRRDQQVERTKRVRPDLPTDQ